ncbi:MAG: hypothetical protein AMDU1_APLC00104G0002 [Thermoplasmatales archaeon A-plasma]|jgi:hypothetical protein|nr:MAG: hypothetical protein AMDU1_APLC00104G0002 [Thermoplasmatales archaeon A-plasma]
MIFPTKHMPPDRSILILGATLLTLMDKAKSISELWEDISHNKQSGFRISYDWFILTLVWLFLIGAVKFESGLVKGENQ